MITRELCETEELTEPLMRWTVPPFGWTFPPCFTFRMLARAFELYIINHTDAKNFFCWHHVQFNLPSTNGYDIILNRVWLIHFGVELVSRVIALFDYGRVYIIGAERVQSSLRQICAGLQFLGIKKLIGSALLEDNNRKLGVDVVFILT